MLKPVQLGPPCTGPHPPVISCPPFLDLFKLDHYEAPTVAERPVDIRLKCLLVYNKSGADPGFVIGGGANPPEGGASILICQIFPKNCMKLRKFWSEWGGGRDAPLGFATANIYLVSTSESESVGVNTPSHCGSQSNF